MTKKLLLAVALVFAIVCIFTSCGDNATTNQNDSHTHNYEEWETTKEATCTVDGIKVRYCSCGQEQTASISALGHTYGEWQTTKQPTTSETGMKERLCACGEKETQTIDKIPVVNTVTSKEWNDFFYNFDDVDYSKMTITIDETTIETEENDVYGYEYTMTADFKNGTISEKGMEFSNGKTYDIDEIDTFNKSDASFEDFISADWMCEFWYELDYTSGGYSLFTYDTKTFSYYALIDIDDCMCKANIYFENGKVTKITLSSVENNEIELSAVYTFAYN